MAHFHLGLEEEQAISRRSVNMGRKSQNTATLYGGSILAGYQLRYTIRAYMVRREWSGSLQKCSRISVPGSRSSTRNANPDEILSLTQRGCLWPHNQIQGHDYGRYLNRKTTSTINRLKANEYQSQITNWQISILRWQKNRIDGYLVSLSPFLFFWLNHFGCSFR
jgi:hypothetical protein